jgi:hypothetical protein
MTTRALSSDFSLIEDKNASKHVAWRWFKRAMRGKAYGRDALNQAWGFYKLGFDEGWNAYDSARIAGAV